MIQSLIHHSFKVLRAVFIPCFCRSCRLFLYTPAIFCARCTALIKPIATKDIFLTPTFAMPVFAVSSYGYPLKDLILSKATGEASGAQALAHLMIAYAPLGHMAIDYCIAVPLHWRRYSARGFNQADIIAQAIASNNSTIQAIQPLKRLRSTPFQSSLPTEQRSSNVSGAFALKDFASSVQQLKGKHLLIVDDLMTTGSTLKEVGKQLLKLKPASITALVGCRF